MNCPACAAVVTERAATCSECGVELSPLPTATTQQRAAGDRPAPRRTRFQTGDVIGQRYRVVEQIGRGGMGEVYRADDLSLDQAVALKFLPERLASDPQRLQGLKREVRIARQISHPYVCRVYDIIELDGLCFLSMEYVRGEDLRSLLQRVGRLAPERAAQVAWQLASGLAAAHEKGVLHRDLKPANVMLDELGHARIMDFGLAAAAGTVAPAEIRAGTPAYMAPEQAAGQEVSERSDVYALGLVLYELFTGRAAASEKGPDGTPRPASELVPGLDHAIDAMLLACLQPEPGRRPGSAMAVRAAFSGGDMLTIAVARGETPRPELVAEAGDFSGLRPPVAWSCLAAALLALGIAIWAPSPRLTQLVPLPKSPPVLVSEARAILAGLGHPSPNRDSTFGFVRDVGYIEHLMSGERSPNWWELLRRGEPSLIRFWYRESPLYLVPHRTTEFLAAPHDPPASVPGMVSLELDTRGRLRRLDAVPEDRDERDGQEAPTDWSPLFAAAKLDPSRFTASQPRWLPMAYADQRAAWEGQYPDAPEVPIRLEAASLHGRVVSFRVIEPWTRSATDATGASRWLRSADVVAQDGLKLLHIVLNGLLLLGLGLLARRNLRARRGDTALAFRLASVLFGLVMLHWLLGAHHVPERSELDLFIGALYRAFFTFGLGWLFYIALEPYARSLWPRSLTSWVRLLGGRVRDPQVGRDLLIGCIYGWGHAALWGVLGHAPVWRGLVPARPDLGAHPAELTALHGVREALAAIVAIQVSLTTHVLYLLVALLLFRFLSRRTWLAVTLHWSGYMLLYSSTFGVFSIASWITLWHFIFFRFGWLAILAGSVTTSVLHGFPLTTDLSAWHAYATWIPVGACLALTLYAFKVSLGSRPIFRDLLIER